MKHPFRKSQILDIYSVVTLLGLAENRMAREVWVEMSRVLGFATDWLRSNVCIIVQYRVNLLQSTKNVTNHLVTTKGVTIQ